MTNMAGRVRGRMEKSNGYRDFNPSGEQEPDPLAIELFLFQIPGEENQHAELDLLAGGRRKVQPVTLVSSRYLRLFKHSLWTDDDMLQLEMNVGKRVKHFGIELSRTLVTDRSPVCTSSYTQSSVSVEISPRMSRLSSAIE